MTGMMTRRLWTLVLLTMIAGQLFAQEKVFRTWWSAELEGELFDLVDFGINPELRFFDNSSRVDAFLTELDASVPLTKWLRTGGKYRFEYQVVNPDLPKRIHRLNAYVELDEQVRRIEIEYRAMYQQEYENFNRSEDGDIPLIQHRHKISLAYDGKGWDLKPQISGEMFYTVYPLDERYQQKLRLTAGLRYKVNKHIDLGLDYKYQQEYYENNPITSNIIAVKFSYDL